MNFNLKSFVDIMYDYPEYKVMQAITESYERHGVLFNNKFIPMTDMVIMGRDGFKKFLYVLLDVDPDFLETCLSELRYITLTLKGVTNE